MKQRFFCLCLSLMVMIMLIACAPFAQGESKPSQPPHQPTPTALASLPKLEVKPNTGFNLDCSHINQTFELYNSGGQVALWVSQISSNRSKDSAENVKVNPASGMLIPGAHLLVTMEGKASAPFVISFIYKESPSHAVGISQGATCK